MSDRELNKLQNEILQSIRDHSNSDAEVTLYGVSNAEIKFLVHAIYSTQCVLKKIYIDDQYLDNGSIKLLREASLDTSIELILFHKEREDLALEKN